MEQTAQTTGALGDTNNDNMLDLVLTYTSEAAIHADNGTYITSANQIDLVILELEKKLGSYPAVSNIENDVTSGGRHKSRVKWRPKSEQIWTGYMGGAGDSVYRAVQP